MPDRTQPFAATSSQQRRAWGKQQLAAPEEVAHGLWAVPIAMSGDRMPYSLGYALFGDDGVHIIDPGSAGAATIDAWTDFLRDHGRGLRDIATILVTHSHNDHLGAAAELRAASGANLVLSALESEVLRGEYRPVPMAGERAAHLHEWGVPEAHRGEFLSLNAREKKQPTFIEADLVLAHDETFEAAGHALRAIITPGHTAGHMCLAIDDLGVMLTGDHVLPQINPGLGLGNLPGSNPLTDYLTSLRAIREFDAYEALPGHEYRFTGLATRSDQIAEHHLSRTRAVAALVPELGTSPVWEYAKRLPWSRGWEGMHGFLRYSALAQTDLHLVAVRSGEADVWLRRPPL